MLRGFGCKLEMRALQKYNLGVKQGDCKGSPEILFWMQLL